MLGWTTETFVDIPLEHHRHTGGADGIWRNWFKNGRANYIVGYHPLFMFAKCVKRLARPPVAIAAAGLWAGYTSGYFSRAPRVDDKALRAYLHREQLARLRGRPSLWGK